MPLTNNRHDHNLDREQHSGAGAVSTNVPRLNRVLGVFLLGTLIDLNGISYAHEFGTMRRIALSIGWAVQPTSLFVEKSVHLGANLS